MKTKEELNAIKQKVDSLRDELRELSPEELKEVIGGFNPDIIFTDPDEIDKDTTDRFIG